MHRSTAWSSASATSLRSLSSAAFITVTAESNFRYTQALGWAARDLFGLMPVPNNPHPSFSRLSRYDETGLLWLLQGREVVALTESTAAIMNATSNVTTYRKHHKPALGPVG